MVDRKSFLVGRFDIDHQVGWVRCDRVGVRFLGFAQIARARRLFWISEPHLVANHLALIAAGEKWKTFTVGGTFEGKEAIPVNAGIARENFIQLFASHTLDRISPKAFDRAEDAHRLTIYEAIAINESARTGIQIRLDEIWTCMNVDLPKDAIARVNKLV